MITVLKNSSSPFPLDISKSGDKKVHFTLPDG